MKTKALRMIASTGCALACGLMMTTGVYAQGSTGMGNSNGAGAGMSNGTSNGMGAGMSNSTSSSSKMRRNAKNLKGAGSMHGGMNGGAGASVGTAGAGGAGGAGAGAGGGGGGSGGGGGGGGK